MLKLLNLKCAFAVCAVMYSLDCSYCASVVRLNGQVFSQIKNASDAKNFADALYETKYDDIRIENETGEVSSTSRLNDAIKIIIGNSFPITSTSEEAKQLHMVFLWNIYKSFSSSNLETQAFCYSEMNKLATTSVEKAKLLLSSQCEMGSFFPIERADWGIISDATYMLANEKNECRAEALQLLQKLKETRRYPMLGR